MIDKIIHQIWVGEYNIPKRELQFANEIKEKHPTYTYNLWTDDNLHEIPERLKDVYKSMYDRKEYVDCADVLRWLVVYQYGGWYLDIDLEFVSNLDTLNIDHRTGIIFGHWGEGWQHCDYTFTNNVFGFEKNHTMVKHIIDNMNTDCNYFWGPHCPSWVGVEGKRFLGLSNQFSNEIWEYHRIVREHLDEHNIEYGDYNKFQNLNFRHYALYSGSPENKEKFAKGLMI